MKTTILVIVSLAVGYGIAYFCAAKNLSPFNRIAADNAQLEALKMGGSMSAGQFKQASKAEVERLSNNYVSWLSNLAIRASKDVPKKDLKNQTVVRGGVFSAKLIDLLAKGNKDVNYIFGMEQNSGAIYMLLTNPEADESTSNEASNELYLNPVDTQSMCPPICPEDLPPIIIPVPPPPDPGG